LCDGEDNRHERPGTRSVHILLYLFAGTARSMSKKSAGVCGRMAEMKRSHLRMLLGLTLCGLAVFAAWSWWQRADLSFTSQSPPTNENHLAHHFAPPEAPLEIAGDDRNDEEKRYRAELQSKVDALLSSASKSDASMIAATERKLPSAALPLVQEAIENKKLPPATTQLIADALSEDALRLRNAVAIQKRLAWYRANTLDIFDKSTNSQRKYPARIALQAAVREWSYDLHASGDEPMIVWREARAAHIDGGDDPLVLLAWAQNYLWLDGRSIAGRKRLPSHLENGSQTPGGAGAGQQQTDRRSQSHR
jgi:hypothetical protein